MSATGAYRPETRRAGSGLSGGVLLTLLVHAGLAAAIVLGRRADAHGTEAPRELMTTELVQFGKPREKFWLPRIAQPPRPKAPPSQIKVSENANAPAAPKEAPRPENADVSKDLKRALDRARKLAVAAEDEDPEGSLSGSRAGTATQASQGDACATAIRDAIRAHWNAPGGLLSDMTNLETRVLVRIGSDGTVSGGQVLKSSGTPLFDDSCVDAVKATPRIPDLPAGCPSRVALLCNFGGS